MFTTRKKPIYATGSPVAKKHHPRSFQKKGRLWKSRPDQGLRATGKLFDSLPARVLVTPGPTLFTASFPSDDSAAAFISRQPPTHEKHPFEEEGGMVRGDDLPQDHFLE